MQKKYINVRKNKVNKGVKHVILNNRNYMFCVRYK